MLELFQVVLDQPELERVAWIEARSEIGSPLRARLMAMLVGDRMAYLRTGGALDDPDHAPLPERIGAYRIVALIGRGGMGAVYRGERDAGDFARTAAIKLIKPGLLSDKLIVRFERERQLLASLEHTNIARLYDGGATKDGAPFIVMEYVDGKPILDWADQARLSREARLRLFLDVCAAVGYAHRNLIVHRDITPSNVLVTGEGVAKLIDFGIARPATGKGAGNLLSVRQLDSLSLTPGFAPPERLAGGEAKTAGDIFLLGKLLRALLKTDSGDPELDAIIARATEFDPEARYPTADALEGDITARLKNFPVSAMGKERRYLVSKFVRRFRFGVAATVIGFALLIGAFGLTLLANFRAETARVEAERRFQQTRSIAKSMLFDAYDAVSKVSGATAAREKLATTAIVYLDALAADKDAPLDVKIEAGRGYLRLAEVTGNGQSAQLGKFEETNALLAKSEAILKPLHVSYPNDRNVNLAYAALLIEQAGVNIYNNNKPQLARAQATNAQRLLAPLPQNAVETARLTALAQQIEGDSYHWVDDYAKALGIHEKVERFLIALSPSLQRDPSILGVRASNLRLLGAALHALKQTGPARDVLDRNIAVSRALAATDPANPDLQRRLAVALRYAGIVHRTNYRDPQARATVEESVAITRRLVERDPADAGALKIFVATTEVYAQILGDAHDYARSYEIGAEVHATQLKLVSLAGNAPGALRSMAASTSTRGGNHYNGEDYVGACHWWRNALAIYLTLEKRGALTETDRKNGIPELRQYLAKGCENGPPRAFDGGEVL